MRFSELKDYLAELTAPERKTQAFFALKAMAVKQENAKRAPAPIPMPIGILHATRGPNRRNKIAIRASGYTGPLDANRPAKGALTERRRALEEKRASGR